MQTKIIYDLARTVTRVIPFLIIHASLGDPVLASIITGGKKSAMCVIFHEKSQP